MITLLREFWLFLRQERKWWLVPVLVVVALLAILVLLTSMYPALAPFVYPLV